MKSWCVFDIGEKKQKLTALELETSQADFWNDQQTAQAKMRELLGLREEVNTWSELDKRNTEALDFLELAMAEDDDSVLADLAAEAEALESSLDDLEFQLMLSGKHDQDDALLSIHAGAGGTESQDWAEMLLRMYLRWAESSGFQTEILDRTDGEEAGVKSVTVLVEGKYAYGYLKAERGVHRLVRISPFDASSRRHTSFAKVEVMPELEDDIEIDINPDDIEMDVFKAGGATRFAPTCCTRTKWSRTIARNTKWATPKRCWMAGSTISSRPGCGIRWGNRPKPVAGRLEGICERIGQII